MPVAPLPARGRLPIMIGGGKPRVLSIAAGVADIVNLNNIRDDGPADQVLAEKVAWVARAAGERMPDVELAMSVPVVAGGSGSPTTALARTVAEDPFAGRLASRMGLDALALSALALAGTTDAIVERLEGWRERHGISYVVVPAGAADAMAPVVERLG